uniref:Phosphoserine phosphatase n=1 Tax=Candidatus Kentrum sp. LFY TaxID=2126342 RepID=A0A450WHZ2_9GAMM|nr:MAG: Phosphoserine phosphatase [Candidatus Kentron sp. LFY]
MNTIIVADFDETLIEQNTLIRVYRGLAGMPLVVSVILALFKGHWLRHGLRAAIKEEMYWRMLRGKSESELIIAARKVARHVTLNEAVVSRIRRLSTQGNDTQGNDTQGNDTQGHDLIVASAALAPIVRAVLQEKGVDFSRVVASEARVEAGKLTGCLIGGECFGENKARRIRQLCDTSYPNARMIAFGNWPDDGPMLAEADEAYIVTGNIIKTLE